jgi:hypothetical protein
MAVVLIELSTWSTYDATPHQPSKMGRKSRGFIQCDRLAISRPNIVIRLWRCHYVHDDVRDSVSWRFLQRVHDIPYTLILPSSWPMVRSTRRARSILWQGRTSTRLTQENPANSAWSAALSCCWTGVNVGFSLVNSVSKSGKADVSISRTVR